MNRLHLLLLCALLSLPMCTTAEPEKTPGTESEEPAVTDPEENGSQTEEKPVEIPEWKEELPDRYGISYLYDWTYIPEIHIKVSLDEWNRLLGLYDEDHDTKEYVHCDVTYDKNGEKTVITDAGIRLKGNTSRFRPEGYAGRMHEKDNTDWHRCHYQLNFRKFVKDSDHEVHGARKVILKFCNGDPTYVREMYAYDFFRRCGVWTAAYDAFCRVYMHIEGDSKEAYLGIYGMIEHIDDEFLKVREEKFEGRKGNIWKCRLGATLGIDDGQSVGADLDDGREYVYELKTNTDEFEMAKAQLDDFRTKLSTLSGDSFHDWISSVCDVPFLLKTYAANVVLGNWDDYWNNANNYYIYFNSKSTDSYKFFFLPYDYDNCLGTNLQIGAILDAGRTNPYKWGLESNPLIHKILQYEDFRKIYTEELKRMVDPASGLFYYEHSIQRILEWQEQIRPYLKNDTGSGNTISDEPASWGNRSYYRLTDENGAVNFFKIRTTFINKYLEDSADSSGN